MDTTKKTQIDDLIIMGRAAPDLIVKDQRRPCCVAGYSHKRGFIRVYPTSIFCPMKRWNVVQVPLERNLQDTRDESWKIQGSKEDWDTLEDKIHVVATHPPNERRQLVYDLVDGCVNDVNEDLRSLGVIKPVKIEGFFKEREKVDEPQHLLLSDFYAEVSPPRNHWVNVKTDFDYIPYLKYRCSDCKTKQKYHEQQLLSIEAYQWMRKHPDNLDQLWENYRIYDDEYDVYLFVGNQMTQRTSFMTIGILRFKKTNYPLQNINKLIPLKKVERFE